MDYKKIITIGFILTCLAQLFIPAKMIMDQEDVLKTGTEYKFRTRPIDPNDPFRGKYITLDFQDNAFPVKDKNDWKRQESVFVELTTNEEGFAKINNVTKTEPENPEYISATISYVNSRQNDHELIIDYPFDRYYMEESKAKPAEETYREANRDTTQITYALVHVKNGEAVLKDVVIDGKSIKDIVEEQGVNNK